MENLEKKEKKENEWPDDMQSGIRLTLTKMKADSEARMVLRELKKKGFDEVRLAKIVYFYCGGDERTAKLGLQQAREFADDLEWLASRLLEDATRLEQIIDKLAQGGTGVVSVEIRIPISGV